MRIIPKLETVNYGKMTHLTTLADIGFNKEATIKKLHGEGAVRRRIMDMGITKGTTVVVRKVAPLGDPMELTVRGYSLTLRAADARLIEVVA